MSQPLSSGKYMIINVAQQRLIGRVPGKGSSVFSLDPLDLNKAWKVLVKSVDSGGITCTFSIGGFVIDSDVHCVQNAEPAEWVLERVKDTPNDVYTIRKSLKYWKLEDRSNDHTKVVLSSEKFEWRFVSDIDLRGLAIVTEPRTIISRPYFAFGSNLSITQMRERCEYSHFICVGVLRNWKWIINKRGVANIVPSANTADIIYGFVYNLQVDDEAELDAREGHAYRKVILPVEVGFDKGKATGWQMVDAMTYVDIKNVQGGTPREEYIPRMKAAMKHALVKGVPIKYVEDCVYPFFDQAFKDGVNAFHKDLQATIDSI